MIFDALAVVLSLCCICGCGSRPKSRPEPHIDDITTLCANESIQVSDIIDSSRSASVNIPCISVVEIVDALPGEILIQDVRNHLMNRLIDLSVESSVAYSVMLDPGEFRESEWRDLLQEIVSMPQIAGVVINTTSMAPQEVGKVALTAKESVPVSLYVPLGLLSRYTWLSLPVYYELSGFWVPSVTAYVKSGVNPFEKMKYDVEGLFRFLTTVWLPKPELGSPIPQRDLELILSGDFNVTLVWNFRKNGPIADVALLPNDSFLNLAKKFHSAQVGVRSLDRLTHKTN